MHSRFLGTFLNFCIIFFLEDAEDDLQQAYLFALPVLVYGNAISTLLVRIISYILIFLIAPHHFLRVLLIVRGREDATDCTN